MRYIFLTFFLWLLVLSGSQIYFAKNPVSKTVTETKYIEIEKQGSAELTLGGPSANVTTNVYPAANNTYDLGTTTPAREWKNIYTTNLTVSGTCTGCSAGSFSYPFPSNATSTLLALNGGITSTASSSLHALTVTLATTTRATTTDLYVSNTLNVVGTLDVDGLTSALVLTGAGGVFAEYAGTSCTNQFVRSLSALGAATCATVVAGDVDLADLTATDSTLTFSGTYDGQTARTIGLNLGNANTWTVLQTFTGLNSQASSTISALFSDRATTTQATSTNLRVSSLGSFANLFIDATGYLQIPHVASTTWTGGVGNLQVNDSIGTSGIAFYDRTNNAAGMVTNKKTIPIPWINASTSVPLVGTTTRLLIQGVQSASLEFTKIMCSTHSAKVPYGIGTTTIRLGDGNNWTEYIICTNNTLSGNSATSTVQQGNNNSINDDDGSISNGIFTHRESVYIEAGNWTGTIDDLVGNIWAIEKW